MITEILIEILLAIALGAVQGITEFLPISSTAHIRLFASILTNGGDVGLSISNILQLGTLLAVVQHYWPELKKFTNRGFQVILNIQEFTIFRDNFLAWWDYPTQEVLQDDRDLDLNYQELEKNEKFKLDLQISQIILGTFPIGVLGLLLNNFASTTRTLQIIAVFLILGSFLMWSAEMIHKKSSQIIKTRVMTKGEVLLIGMFQSLAIFPGISRSGSTISGALYLGRDRKESVNFSFLISIPAILLAGVMDTIELVFFYFENGLKVILPGQINFSAPIFTLSLISLLAGVLASYIFGIICLKWLLKYLSSNTFKPFIWYRIGLAIILLIWTFVRL